MSEFGWREAIIKVLNDSAEAMHYGDIAEEIAEKQYRTSLGATPANTVNAHMSDSLNNEGVSSPFIRVSRGMYSLRPKAADSQSQVPTPNSTAPAEAEPTGFINAFGMYWLRSQVSWKASVRLLGKQQDATNQVDFTQQRGVYLLHDGRSVVYVGRVIDQGLGIRLRQHTLDRLNGRWDRFSWFGIYRVSENGEVIADQTATYGIETLITAMEALLIESLEPPQNRRRGDDFRASEFLQVTDPDIEKAQVLSLMDEFRAKMMSAL